MARPPNFQTKPDPNRMLPDPRMPRETLSSTGGHPVYSSVVHETDNRSADELEKELAKEKLRLTLQDLDIAVPPTWDSMSLEAAKEYVRRVKAKKELAQLKNQSGGGIVRGGPSPRRTQPV
jgi:hypothetical protein